MEGTVGRIALHARCLEAAVHQPDGWQLRAGDVVMPVEVRTSDIDDRVKATFVAGPIPAGDHVLELELDGVPMHVRAASFDSERCFWVFEVEARLAGR